MKQRNKNIALVIGFVLALLLAYTLAFSKTLELKRETAAMNMAFEADRGIEGKLVQITGRERAIDSLLSTYNIKSNSIHNSLLEYINEQTENRNIKVAAFSEPHIDQKENRELHSFVFRLEGSYPDLIKTVHEMEQQYNFGKVVHLNFEKKRDYRLKRDRLFCDIILQTVISAN